MSCPQQTETSPREGASGHDGPRWYPLHFRRHSGARPPRHGRGCLLWLVALLAVTALAFWEAETSTIQSVVLHRIARGFTYQMAPGRGVAPPAAPAGPYDRRRGYDRLPVVAETLSVRGYPVAAQVEVSEAMRRAVRYGLYPIYQERTRAGLTILDREGRKMYEVGFPERTFAAFDSIPPLIVETLLFIENREILATAQPYRNPAVEWDRLARAGIEWVVAKVRGRGSLPGGSTLATQIEKYRHSPEGFTRSPKDKLRQMVAASLRAYQKDRNTLDERRQIVLEYINSVPLAALPGYGEVNSLGDGLWAWYDADVRAVSQLLSAPPGDEGSEFLRLQAEAYKRVLSLFVAHRRPSHYLIANRPALEIDTDRYLRRLAAEGIIPDRLRDEALRRHLQYRQQAPQRARPSFIERKATNAIRTRLLGLTGVGQLYELDRLDLSVQGTLDGPVQRRITGRLQRLGSRDSADSLGLRGFRLLQEEDLSRVVYSFTLYERTPRGNLLRVQADNLDQPLDINEGAKLDLGSTAKLRTLVHYLELVASVQGENAGRPAEDLRQAAASARDPIRRWVLERLSSVPDTTLASVLVAALDRRYSASPEERFFTGGGLHTFANFDPLDDGKVLSVREGLQQSVNLVFVRLMRDIVRYHTAADSAVITGILEDPNHPRRTEYLRRFADKEGRIFLARFYKKYEDRPPETQLETMVSGFRPTARRLAAVHRYVRPEATLEEFADFLGTHLGTAAPREAQTRRLYDEFAPGKFSLQDQGYVASVHPLELWLVGYLHGHPEAGWREVAAAGGDARQEVYRWLMSPSKREGQNQRIRGVLEEDAFRKIHRAWRRLGYPFESLVPSYASSIGSSADRPAALAELVGVLLNDGVRQESRRLERLHFADGTPYEVLFEARIPRNEAVLHPEVARAARTCLIEVVESGTARRVAGAFRAPDGTPIPVGGKTGTGDNRRETYGAGGKLIDSKVVSRTATFVFFIGDRFYGTVSAHVPGPEAESYRFTSALPVQLLKALAPDLTPLVAGTSPATGKPEAP